MNDLKRTSSCLIHNGHGSVQRLATTRSIREPQVATPSIAGLVPVTDIMSRSVECARADLPVRELLDLVLRHNIGCVPIVDVCGCPVGMVTKRDLVEQLANLVHDEPLARLVDRLPPSIPNTAGDVMLPVAVTVDEHASIARAAAVMAQQNVHHLPIVARSGSVVGLISSLDIVRWLATNDGLLAPEIS